MNQNLPNLETIFAEAIAIESAPQRTAYVDQACAGQPDLLREVKRLVKDYFRAGRFLEACDSHVPWPHAREDKSSATTVFGIGTEACNTMIGPYKLVEQIGEGGMGMVYVAEQEEPIRRRVALKIVKPGLYSRQILARFEAERQALALMDHPNIAKVLDAGTIPVARLELTESRQHLSADGDQNCAPTSCNSDRSSLIIAEGRPYFVMELVKGIPITEYCQQNNVSIAQRLQLFVNVCQAVQHAHQKGIIHRDIKPSNVLIASYDGMPVVKVIDFGIAKAMQEPLTDKTVYTRLNEFLGTPMYMSPEQMGLSSLDVDTRSDIYSLGVLLYELLTAATPFDEERLHQADFDEMRRIIRDEEPIRPSLRISTVRDGAKVDYPGQGSLRPLPQFGKELDWIVMKALEKDRNRRYQTASSFAQDVENFLNNEPVQAHPPSSWYRLHKFVRKHKGVLTTVVLVMAALIVGMILSFAQAIRAERNLIEARRHQQQAETHFAWAEQAVEQLLTEVSEGMEGLPHMEHVRRRLLEKALQLQLQFLDAKDDDPGVLMQTARAYRRTGEIYYMLGRFDEAEDAFHNLLDLAQRKTAIPAEIRELEILTGIAYRYLGRIQLQKDEFQLAEALLNQAHRIESDLIASAACDVPLLLAAAETCTELALLLQKTNRLAEAETAYLEAVRQLEVLVNSFPSEPRYLYRLALNRSRLGNLLRITKRGAKALEAHQQAVSLYEELIAKHPSRPEYQHRLAIANSNLALVMIDAAEYEQIEPIYARTLGLYHQLTENFPGVADYRLGLAKTYFNLGYALKKNGRADSAEQCYRQSLRTYEQLVEHHGRMPAYMTGMAMCHNNLANLISVTRRIERLGCHFCWLPGPSDASSLIGTLAMSEFSSQHRIVEMIRGFQAAVAIHKQLADANPQVPGYQSRTAVALEGLASSTLSVNRDTDKAIQLYFEAMNYQKAALRANPKHPTYREHMRVLCIQFVENCLLKVKDHQKAAVVIEQLIDCCPDSVAEHYRSAALLARCAALANLDKSIPLAERQAAVQKYGDRSVAVLRAAIRIGFRNANQLKGDNRFQPLQDRADFQRLVAELQQSTAPRK